jgi:succinyl-diaminopimelate desuccinylase
MEDIVQEEKKSICESLESGPLREIREALAKGLSKGISFEAALTIFEDRPWTKTFRDEPVVQAVSRAMRSLTGEEPVYDGVPGATDGTFLSAWSGIPIVTVGAGKWMIPHQKDEWVSIDELCLTAKIYALSALEYLGVAE